MKVFRAWPLCTSHIQVQKEKGEFSASEAAQRLLFNTQGWINQQLGGENSLVPHNWCKFCSWRSPLVSCLAPPMTPVRVKIAVHSTWMDVWFLQEPTCLQKDSKMSQIHLFTYTNKTNNSRNVCCCMEFFFKKKLYKLFWVWFSCWHQSEGALMLILAPTFRKTGRRKLWWPTPILSWAGLRTARRASGPLFIFAAALITRHNGDEICL